MKASLLDVTWHSGGRSCRLRRRRRWERCRRAAAGQAMHHCEAVSFSQMMCAPVARRGRVYAGASGRPSMTPVRSMDAGEHVRALSRPRTRQGGQAVHGQGSVLTSQDNDDRPGQRGQAVHRQGSVLASKDHRGRTGELHGASYLAPRMGAVVDRSDPGAGADTDEHKPHRDLAHQRVSAGQSACASHSRGRSVRPEDRAQQRALEAGGGDHGQHQRQAGALHLQLASELSAAGADLEMAAQIPAAGGRPTKNGQLLAHGLAVDLACLAVVHEVRPGLEDERLDARGGTVEDLADLGVAEVSELEEHKRGALLLGQRAHVGHEVTQVLPAPDDLVQPFGVSWLVDSTSVQVRDLAAGAEHRQAPVTGHGIQPRAQVNGFGRVDDLAMRPGEHL